MKCAIYRTTSWSGYRLFMGRYIGSSRKAPWVPLGASQSTPLTSIHPHRSGEERQQSSQSPETMMVGLSLSLVLPLFLHLASPAPAPAEDAKEVAQVHSPALGEVVQVRLQLEIFFFFCFLIPWSCRSPMEASLRQREQLCCLTRSCSPCKRSTSFL